MSISYSKMKPLFLQQSYMDAWEDYRRALRKRSFPCWDYVILTASNEDQAAAYRKEIEYRVQNALLPGKTKYVVISDPAGKRVGSGGATLNVLRYLVETEGSRDVFQKKLLVIHSGGDSKRVPQYSVCGKLFSPVPRELPNGRASTLFDEFMIATAGIPARMQGGMLVMSGDVLLLFNALQIDLQYQGAAAISIKEPVSTGKEHGVFLNDGYGIVKRFLHKQSEEQLRNLGAVNEQGMVDLDTGAVMLDAGLLDALFSLIAAGDRVDSAKFDCFVNERARISFYGDFLYPLAKESTLEEYYREAPEGSFCEELKNCRTKIWEALHGFQMKVICLSPAEFIHFGTTRELLDLVTNQVEDYEYLHWKKQVCTNRPEERDYAAHNSLIAKGADIGAGCYLEDCDIGSGVSVGEGSILSGLCLRSGLVPPKVTVHGLRLKDGRYTVRIYGVEDNPKGTLEQDTGFLYGKLGDMLSYYGISPEKVWGEKEHYLWFAKLYPICDSMEEAFQEAMQLVKLSEKKAPSPAAARWLSMERCSLYESFAQADVKEILPWKTRLEDLVLSACFAEKLERGVPCDQALQVFGQVGIDQKKFDILMERANGSALLLKMRIYYALSRYMKERNVVFAGDTGYDVLERLCFDSLGKAVYDNSRKYIQDNKNYRIENEHVLVQLPVRVNWGGGWTDTPPQCNEQGGVVLNAAISLNGVLPVQVHMRRLDELCIVFESEDLGARGEAHSVGEIRDCHNPYDFFALHKAALIACGIVPMEGTADLREILQRLGGGIYLSTQVAGVPKGSGLGTSSILSAACVKAVFEFLGRQISDEAVYETVSCMEQIMSTGGGWQDQVGGLTGGIKFITTKPGLHQQIEVSYVTMPEEAKKELQERFALIYTGQRRLARNLLRDVIGNYIGGRKESVEALYEMKRVAAMMRFELEEGNIDGFAALFNRHWELSKKLDAGSTNTCIEQIFLACEDLIDGRFIAGAGGGGFIQVILKKNITKEQLEERLHGVFQDSGVAVWECAFV